MTEEVASLGDAEPGQPGAESGAGGQMPLTAQVAGRLRDMIVQDELVPGDRIRERHLADRLNVSRTPLREALKVLATEGLVELLPRRGAVVASPEADEIHDLLLLLGTLESLAGELACARATDADIDEIRALHYEMLAAYARKDRLAYFKLNQKIHLGIVAVSRNEALIETHARINARLYRVRYRSNLRNVRWSSAIEEHEQILGALGARDAAALSGILKSHLNSTWANARESSGEEAAEPNGSEEGAS